MKEPFSYKYSFRGRLFLKHVFTTINEKKRINRMGPKEGRFSHRKKKNTNKQNSRIIAEGHQSMRLSNLCFGPRETCAGGLRRGREGGGKSRGLDVRTEVELKDQQLSQP